MTAIRKVAVLGAGVMGSGIAAHLANAGIPVLLLDIVPFNAAEGEDTSSPAFRNKYAEGALKKLTKLKPSPIFSRAVLGLIETGNFDDHMGQLNECDWVVEAVKEDLGIKQGLFAKVEANMKEGAIISSNTSGLSIVGMLQGRSEAFRKNFLVTHFFNPVRYMKLLELVEGPETDKAVTEAMHAFGEEVLGKGIVYGKDTTNFIANRIGVYGMMKTMAEMQKAELSIEAVDKIFGPAMGRAKSAVFRTADVVGLDTFIHVSTNCYDSLTHDEERDVFKIPGFMQKLVDDGALGQKSGKGFYFKTKVDGKKAILSLDLNSGEYTPQEKVRFDSIGEARKMNDVKKRVAHIMKADDKAGKFAEAVTLATLAYTSRRIPEIADDIVNIDRGMRWGFGWDLGPFEIWDAYGVKEGVDRMRELGLDVAPWVFDMLNAGRTSFYSVEDGKDVAYDIPSKEAKPVKENPRTLRIEYLKRGNKEITSNLSATLWDANDGIALLEFHSKMNALDTDIIEMLGKAVDVAEKDFRGLVIGNDDPRAFSAGANILFMLMGAQNGQFEDIRKMINGLQTTLQRVRYSRIPVVTAVHGLALGGGCEVTMSGNVVQAAAESYVGLVEVGIGLIPGGGGNLQLLRNLYGPYAGDKSFDPFPFIQKAFMSIGMGKVATSAEEAREMGFLGPVNGISMSRDFLINDAKQRAIGLAESGFIPPRKTEFLLPGKSGQATIDMLLYDMQINTQITEHDRFVGGQLATVLTGGDTSPTAPVSEERLLELEQEAFLTLIGTEKTQERMKHMLMTNKPLRN